MPEDHLVPRKNVLTNADLDALRELLEEHHSCKFKTVSEEQMAEMVRFSQFFLRIEKKVLDAITWGVLALVGGMIILFYNHGMFKK